MNKIIQKLTDDHCSFLILQNIFRDEMHVFHQGSEYRDIPLLLDIMDYFIGYSQTFHHALEDRIYDKIRTSISDFKLTDTLDAIEMQHAQLDVLSKRLLADFTAIANSQIITTARIQHDFKAYVDLSEEHMRCENAYLIPIISQLFTEQELVDIDRSVKEGEAHYEEKLDMYTRLLEQICDERLAASA